MKTKAELEYLILTKRLAPAKSLTQRELTRREIDRMPEPVYAWHEQNNPGNVEAALNRDRAEKEAKRNEEVANTQTFWDEGETTLDSLLAIKKFCARHPQFRGDLVSNREALVGHLKSANLPVTARNLTDAFQTLGRDGRLVLSPSKVGIIRIRTKGQTLDIRKEDLRIYERRDPNVSIVQEEDDSVTSSRLSRHVLLDVLLSPYGSDVQRLREQGSLSANEYHAAHPEAFVQEKPSIVQINERQAVATLLNNHPDLVHSESNAQRISNYIRERQMGFTLSNLEAAYTALREANELELSNALVATHGTGGTRLIDLSANNDSVLNGFVANDTNLSAKIAKMDSHEYEEWLRSPSNRKAADNLAFARR